MGRVRGWVVGATVVGVIVLDTLVGASSQDAGAQPALRIGEHLPGFDLESLEGERLNPESLRGEASLVLVFFRGTW